MSSTPSSARRPYSPPARWRAQAHRRCTGWRRAARVWRRCGCRWACVRCYGGRSATASEMASEIEAGGSLDPFGGDGVDVALAQDNVLVAAHLDLVAVVGREQDLVTDLHAAHVLTDARRLAPHLHFYDQR